VGRINCNFLCEFIEGETYMNRKILGRLATARVSILAHIVFATVSVMSAQTGARVAPLVPSSQQEKLQRQATAQISVDSDLRLYDDFNERWLSREKWETTLPNCWGNVLECVRQIRDGKLYLSVRNFGYSNSDTGIDYSESEVFFRNQRSVRSIAADVTVQNYLGKGCPTNNTDDNSTQVRMGGAFFNSGSGNAFDDVTAVIVFLADVSNPRAITVAAGGAGKIKVIGIPLRPIR
jgi:hypothetical protein